MRRAGPLLVALAAGAARPAAADPPCRTVEVSFTPAAPDLQIAVWLEDVSGRFVDTLYITRLTGQFGLGNRPGSPLLKTARRWPYGRREMVAPVWAHRRGKRYPRVVMGGACGNSPDGRCPDGSACGNQCWEETAAYHDRVSSLERFYCAPSSVDAMSCASVATLSKGAYAARPAFSLYPPRADLTAFDPVRDSPDVLDFARQNDLAAISKATPPAGAACSPWAMLGALRDGDYAIWIEVSQAEDFNAHHRHPQPPDRNPEWNSVGREFLGQPSVLYRVPIRVGGEGWTAYATDYAGYGSWDGGDGDLRPPDGTITTGVPGSGAGRLAELREGGVAYRARAVVGGCAMSCPTPGPMEQLALTPSASEIAVEFRRPAGVAATRFAVRYREGEGVIDDANFDRQLAAPDPVLDGERGTARIVGLYPQTAYTVAVRGSSACGGASPVVSRMVATSAPSYAVLHGCFVATAAFGSPMAGAVERLRRLRDRRLLDNPAGQLFVTAYYALSPPVAGAVAGDERLRAAARAALAPLVDLAALVAP